MLKKSLILIGRTFIATFIVVNFFNIIPLNFSNNNWFIQVSMLFVDTSSLMLLGLASLKVVSSLSINNGNKEIKFKFNNSDENQSWKYEKNLEVLNKFSFFWMYFFVFIALLQTFIFVNGINQIDIFYSDRLMQFEKSYQNNKNKLDSESLLNIEKNKINNPPNMLNLSQKDRIIQSLTKQKSNSISYLLRDTLKIFLMSLIWAYGFLKLARF